MEQDTKTVAMLFGRMNPPTGGEVKDKDGKVIGHRGHEENINGLKALAAKHNADHLVIASGSHDPKKNPLSPEQKEKHLKRAFPGTNIKVASKDKPTLMHHASDLHKQGYNHLILTGGGDRAEEYKNLLHKYNGVAGKHGYYNFKKISVLSTGERKAGVSGTDMRNHVKNNDYQSFKNNLPSHLQKPENEKHARELFHDVKKGMGIHENVNRGMFKALFLVGGPGSGKDVIVREAIAEKNAIEINSGKAYDFLMDKKKLSEQTRDSQLSAIRNRSALIINGASDDREKINTIKEELEELGYTCMMVFVNTTNEVSSLRNQQHSRIISEQIRFDKWTKSQENLNYFYDAFDYFLEFDNSTNLQKSDILIKEQKENEISSIANEISTFFKTKVENDISREWLRTHGKLDINEDIKWLFKGELNEIIKHHDNYQDIRKKHNHKDYGSLVRKTRVLKDGNGYKDNALRKSGVIDDIRDGDVKKNSDYIWLTYEAKEQTEPTLKVNPEPKTKKFDTDKESNKFKKKAGVSLLPGKVQNGSGIGSTYDTRTQGSVYPMSGLGNVTYRESFSKFRKKMSEAIDDPGASDMGTFGGMANGVNKEPMQTPLDKVGTQTINKKKKIKEQKGEGQTPETLAKKHGVDVNLINKELEIGTGVEHEHTKSDEKARKIAMDHVAEIPDYYTRLTKMEKQAKKQEKK